MSSKDFNIFQGLATENNQYKYIPIEALVYNDEYERYDGERYEDMVQSIKNNGILIPLIVCPNGDGKYIILSGNNRRYCAEGAGLNQCPCVVKEGLTEAEKQAYIDETNVFQRGFGNLKISKQAEVVARRHSEMFSEKRLREIQNEIAKINGERVPKNETATVNNSEVEASDDNGNKISKLAAVGREYNLGKSSIARLIRINYLIPELIPFVDNGDIALRVGVDLSYLDEKHQAKVCDLLSKGKVCDMKKANLLRSFEQKGELNAKLITDIITDKYSEEEPKPIKSVKLKYSFIKKYFPNENNEKNIADTIEAALIQYLHINVETNETDDTAD